MSPRGLRRGETKKEKEEAFDDLALEDEKRPSSIKPDIGNVESSTGETLEEMGQSACGLYRAHGNMLPELD